MAESRQNDNQESMSLRPMVLVAGANEMGMALMDEAHMEGLIMQKCSGQDIRYSNAFMVATGKESEDPAVKYYKIQDKVFFNAFSIICRNEYFCTEDKCRGNDAIAAEFLIERDIDGQSEYKGLTDIKPIELPDKQRKGIHYICPLTALDEIALPVRLYGRTMGVLIVGQISAPESRAELEKCIRNKLKKEPENAEDIIKRIRVENRLDELTEKIFNTVEEIEAGLREYYIERQNQYVLNKSSELIKEFKDAVENESITEGSLNNIYPAADLIEQYETIGKCIRQQLNMLCDAIGISDREIFIPAYDNLVDNQYDEIVSGNTKFHFGRWIDNRPERDVICGNLDEYIENKGRSFDLLAVAPKRTYPIAIAVKSEDFLDRVEEPERELLKKTFCDTFSKFAEYAQMVGMEAKSDYYRVYLDNYMSIQRHELGQSNAGYQMLLEEFKRNKTRFLRIFSEIDASPGMLRPIREFISQCDNFIRDSEAYLHTARIRIQSTKYLIEFSGFEKTYFYPYDEFLFKWNQIYGKSAQEAGVLFRFPFVSISDYTRPRMYGDPLMIEQAAYNLTNNAIKYALPGTAVSLDCRLNRERDRYEIIVNNIGRPLKNDWEKDSIFYFGKRGSNNRKKGSGLGLFLTKQIAQAHGGDVICETENFSKFNWTLINLYIKYYESKRIRYLCKDEKLYLALKQEREERQEEINRVVVKEIKDNEFTPMYVNQNICSGMTRFKFTFWIPYTGD